MTVELLPVIEIVYYTDDIPAPNVHPYWENADVWDTYHRNCLDKAGFKDRMKPCLPGSSFYELSTISESNLIKLVIDTSQGFRDKQYNKDETCSLSGGYVLIVNNQDKYFPQCCSELSDIIYWERLSLGQHSYNEGHPTPTIEFNRNKVTLDFTVHEFDEPFEPTPPAKFLELDRSDLNHAVSIAKQQLYRLQEQLEHINTSKELHIEDIGDLLIWRNLNYE
jgi:hypothetical protein